MTKKNFWKADKSFSLTTATMMFMFGSVFASAIAHKYEWLGVKDISFEWSFMIGWLTGLLLGWDDTNENHSHTRR